MRLTAPRPAAVGTIRDDFDRLLDQFSTVGRFGATPRLFDAMWSPALDFSENDKEYIVRLEVPGIPKEELEVNVEGRTLTVTGRRTFEIEEKDEEYLWHEREQGRFVRAVELPAAVDATKVAAICEFGVMTIRLPKLAPAIKSKILVK
jgi:HSP20 family protein